MSFVRTVKCGTCSKRYTERKSGAGFPNWSAHLGVVLNGDVDPHFCPNCTTNIMDFISDLAEGPVDEEEEEVMDDPSLSPVEEH